MMKYSFGILAIALSIFFPGTTPALTQNITNPSGAGFNSGRQYMVYVKDVSLLPQVKSVIPDAFVTSLDSGAKVIQLGRYNNQGLAQRQVDQLRSSGISPEISPVAARVANSSMSSPLTFEGTTTNSMPIATDIPSPTGNSNSSNLAMGKDLVPLPGVPYTPSSSKTNSQAGSKERSIEISRGMQSGANVSPSPDVPTPLGVNDTVATAPTPERNRYFVVVPSSQDTVLQKARTISPTARMAVSERGTYVEVQGFSDRSSAENLAKTVRSQGLDARVIYF
jgi:hypothetical protein